MRIGPIYNPTKFHDDISRHKKSLNDYKMDVVGWGGVGGHHQLLSARFIVADLLVSLQLHKLIVSFSVDLESDFGRRI